MRYPESRRRFSDSFLCSDCGDDFHLEHATQSPRCGDCRLYVCAPCFADHECLRCTFAGCRKVLREDYQRESGACDRHTWCLDGHPFERYAQWEAAVLLSRSVTVNGGVLAPCQGCGDFVAPPVDS